MPSMAARSLQALARAASSLGAAASSSLACGPALAGLRATAAAAAGPAAAVQQAAAAAAGLRQLTRVSEHALCTTAAGQSPVQCHRVCVAPACSARVCEEPQVSLLA